MSEVHLYQFRSWRLFEKFCSVSQDYYDVVTQSVVLIPAIARGSSPSHGIQASRTVKEVTSTEHGGQSKSGYTLVATGEER
jgi:hypothetical protein